MATDCAVGSFLISSADVATTVYDHVIGFDPKVIIFFSNGRSNATDTVGRASVEKCLGFCTSTSNRAVCAARSSDAVAAAVVDGAQREDSVIIELNATPTVTGLLDIQAMTVGGGGFQTIIDDQFVANLRVGFIAFGGTDITNATIVRFSMPTATGNHSVTTVGFQGDIVFFMTTGNPNNPPSFAAEGQLNLGVAMSSSMRATQVSQSNNGSVQMDTASYCTDLECLSLLSAANPLTSGPDRRHDFVEFLSNGFTLNALEVIAAFTRVWALVIKGGNWSINPFLTQTDTSTPITISGLSFQPKGGLVVSSCRAESTQNASTAHSQYSIGAFTSSSSRLAMATLDEDALADSETTTAIEYDAVYANIAADSTIQGLMDVTSINTDGVSFVMDDADPSQSFGWCVTFGEAAVVAAATYPGYVGRGGWF